MCQVDYTCKKGVFFAGESVMLTWVNIIITQNILKCKLYWGGGLCFTLLS
jgi:hypothetical protein